MKAPRMIFSLLSLLALLPIGIAESHPAIDLTDNTSSSSLAAPLAQILPLPIEFTEPMPPNRGRPGGRREGGASRGSCGIAGQLPLTALVPSFEVDIIADQATAQTRLLGEKATDDNTTEITLANDIFSLTTQGHPSFWFYVPYSLETTTLEFVLQDANDNTLYRSHLSKDNVGQMPGSVFDSGDHGIIQITLPESAPALQPETTYHWFFLAYCEPSTPDFVEGWIARQPSFPASFVNTLMSAPLRDQAMFYAQNGIWQETLTVLGEQYRENETNLEVFRDWESLLRSANLEHLTEQPLLDCCEIE